MDIKENGDTSGPSSDSDEDYTIPLPARLRDTSTTSPVTQISFSVIDLTKEDADTVISQINPIAEACTKNKPHIISTRSHVTAESYKKTGNYHYEKGDYLQAIENYSNAIDTYPGDASYFGNRSACLMILSRYKEALPDIKKSIEIDCNFRKGYLRLIRTTLALGNISECELAFQTIRKLGLDVDANAEFERLSWFKSHLKEIREIREAGTRKDYKKVVHLVNEGLKVACANNQLKALKADALVRLGNYIEAERLCNEIIEDDNTFPRAYYVKAFICYLEDQMDMSIDFVGRALKCAPDNCAFQHQLEKLKLLRELRNNARSKYFARRFQESMEDYFKCLDIVTVKDMENKTIQSKLSYNLALVNSKLGKVNESIEMCYKAIALNSNYIKAICLRARQYVSKEMFDEAKNDFEAALRINPKIASVKEELKNAVLSTKRAKRKEYYKILDVDTNASESEIRKAYKRKALLHHPDKNANEPESVQRERVETFKKIGEAHEVLVDPIKRKRYDNIATDMHPQEEPNQEPEEEPMQKYS